MTLDSFALVGRTLYFDESIEYKGIIITKSAIMLNIIIGVGSKLLIFFAI